MLSLRLSFVVHRLCPALALPSRPGGVSASQRLTPRARRSLRVCLFIITLAFAAFFGWRADKASPGVAAATAPATTVVVNSTADAELSEIQLVTVTGSGTFTLTFNGHTTSAITPSVVAQAENSLTALPSIGGVGARVYVSKSGDVFRIIFSGTLGAMNLPEMTATGMGGATATVSTEQDGMTGCPGANCTLRGAIAAASPGDTIQFSPLFNTPQTITLTAGELPLDKDLTIEGPGANLLTVSGNNASRVFYLPEPSLGAPQVLRTVTLAGMTIANGNGVGRSVINGGVGGGLYNGGHLTLLNTAVIGSSTIQGGGILQGFSETTLDIIGSTLSGNTASDRGGAIAFRCGPCTLTLTNSTIAGNSTSNSGGALAMPINGPFIGVNIRNSTITGNSSPNNSGGLEIGVPGARLNVKNSLIALNTGPDVRMVNGVFASQGYNLIGNLTTTGGVTTTQASDQLGADPLLELDGMSKPLLAFNGGPTRTVRPLSGSPARDNGASSVFDEAQTVVITGSAGTFTLTFNGQTTNPLAFNASATDVQTELNALSSIGGVGGNVTVSKSGTRYIFIFGGGLAATNLPLMTALGTGGATPTIGALVDGGGAPLTSDQRGQARPVNLAGVPDAVGGNGSDIGAYEAQCATAEPTITPNSLPSALNGTPYTQTLAVTGGTPPFTFSVSSGSLPPGLMLAPDGTLSGTPTAPGAFSFTVMVHDGSSCGASRNYTLDVACTSASVSPASLPAAAFNVAYNQVITASPAGGGYTFAVTSGALPNGLSLASDGTLSGAPTQNGVFSFRVTATGFGGACSGFRDYTLAISCLTISPASLPNGAVGVAYGQTISAAPTGAYSFAVTSGALPAGLSLNAATGALTGTPTALGAYNFTVTASIAGCAGPQSYTLVVDCPALTLNPDAPLPSAQAGVSYAQLLSVTPAGSYTFSITSGSLPVGLSLNALTGLISGTPTTTGPSSFTVKVQGANGCFGTRAYSLQVACPAITLNPSTLPSGTTGAAYSQSVSAIPLGGSYTYAISGGSLPAGLNLNVATGSLSGTPSANGSFSFTITATGFGGCTGSRAYTLVIGSGGSCATITLPGTLPNGNIAQLYNASVAAAPAGLYNYTVVGSTPPGVTLYSANGLLLGYPTAAGSYTFTVTATQGACSASREYTVLIGKGTGAALIRFSDFDGDGKSDLAVFRGGDWLVVKSGDGQLQATAWGSSAAPYHDVTVAGDYDGDGKTDLAVFRRGGAQAGYWFIKQSSDGQVQQQLWGVGTDVAVPGDYDGDGKTDLAVWRPGDGNWYIRRSSDSGSKIVLWGQRGDVPLAADYDGDGQTDLAVWRLGNGAWYIRRSSDGAAQVQVWGAAGDTPVPADYDGDGKADLAVWRGGNGTWYILKSSDGQFQLTAWGAAGLNDVLTPGDYDGDGKADIGVWRPGDGTWYVRRSADGGNLVQRFGQSGDTPVSAKGVR